VRLFRHEIFVVSSEMLAVLTFLWRIDGLPQDFYSRFWAIKDFPHLRENPPSLPGGLVVESSQGFQTLANASAASDFNGKGPSTISGTWLPTPHRRTRIVPIEDRTTYHPEIWISSSCNGAMTSLVRLSRIVV
jgi:hypothetical protein